ncbi:MAG: hypothetical protein PHD82_16545, partial [Candidatus Riflebacteria bacterium]|nr:hypothetical protein [Candidatus Riflebacteria bacterium]
MKKLSGFILIFAMLLLMPVLLPAAGSAPTLQTSTLGALYIDVGHLFSFYANQAAEMNKPENAANLAEIETKFKGYTNQNLNLGEFFKKVDEFARSAIFVPEGSLWFTIDTSYRPTLSLKAKIKPLELIEFIEQHLGKLQQKPLKREKDLVEYRIPAPEFSMIASIRPDGVYLQSEGAANGPEDKEKWANLSKNVSSEGTLIAAEIDLNGIKNLLAGKSANVQHGVCFSNLRMLSAALEMYAMDKETSLEILDQKQLKTERYLADELVCPNEGKYSLNKEGEVVCSTHGTIKNPVKIESFISKANIPEQYRP